MCIRDRFRSHPFNILLANLITICCPFSSSWYKDVYKRQVCVVDFRKWGRKCNNSEWEMLPQLDNGVFVASVRPSIWFIAKYIYCPFHRTLTATGTGHRGLGDLWLRFRPWRFLKSCIAVNKPYTISVLKLEIWRVSGETEPHLCGKILEGFVGRGRMCQ